MLQVPIQCTETTVIPGTLWSGVCSRKIYINNIPCEDYKTYPTNIPDTIH